MENNITKPPEASSDTSVSEILGVQAVSQSLSVSKATVLRWIRAEKIEGFFRIGRKWLVRKADFEKFISLKVENESNK